MKTTVTCSTDCKTSIGIFSIFCTPSFTSNSISINNSNSSLFNAADSFSSPVTKLNQTLALVLTDLADFITTANLTGVVNDTFINLILAELNTIIDSFDMLAQAAASNNSTAIMSIIFSVITEMVSIASDSNILEPLISNLIQEATKILQFFDLAEMAAASVIEMCPIWKFGMNSLITVLPMSPTQCPVCANCSLASLSKNTVSFKNCSNTAANNQTHCQYKIKLESSVFSMFPPSSSSSAKFTSTCSMQTMCINGLNTSTAEVSVCAPGFPASLDSILYNLQGVFNGDDSQLAIKRNNSQFVAACPVCSQCSLKNFCTMPLQTCTNSNASYCQVFLLLF